MSVTLEERKVVLIVRTIMNTNSGVSTVKIRFIVVQASLERYQFLWKKFGRIWHLKASEFNVTSLWKSQQEMNMQQEKGAFLMGKSLDSFIRMIETSIPKRCLQSIDSSVVVKLN